MGRRALVEMGRLVCRQDQRSLRCRRRRMVAVVRLRHQRGRALAARRYRVMARLLSRWVG